jgi:flavorubredoxin
MSASSSAVEIRPGLYRTSVWVEKLKLAFSQFFVQASDGALLCVETGMRAHFPVLAAQLDALGLSAARVGSVVVPHFEADEMGALPEFLAANPALTAYAHPICAHALTDLFDVRAKPLRHREAVVLSGTEVVPLFATHVHQWDSLVVYLPKYKALLSSDLFMSHGDVATPHADPVAAIVASIETSGYLPSLRHFAAALRTLQALDLDLILPMHGPAVTHDIPAVITGLLAYCERTMAAEGTQV